MANDLPQSNHFDEYVPLDTAPLPDLNIAQLMKGHMWEQQGTMLHCKSCTYPHGMMLHGHEKITHQEGALPVIKMHDPSVTD